MRTELFVRRRLFLVTLAFTLLYALLGVRVGKLTLIEAEELTAYGVRQWTRDGVVLQKRGAVTDRNGSPLAVSATAYIVSASPRQITDEEAFLDAVCGTLSLERESVRGKLADKTRASVTLKRQVSRADADALRALIRESGGRVRGVTFEEDTRRVYLKGAFLTQALGLTNVDSVGQSGLEQQYESVLAGRPGRLVTEVDAKARTLPDGKTLYVPPETGATLRLTIDESIQSFCERAMRECLEVNEAKAVHALVMDVRTGAILAMATKPDYDPNAPPRDDLDTLRQLMRISLISDAYEPGSTFKMLTTAAALDSGVATPDDRFYCSAKITVSGDTIRCWGRPHGAETLTEGLRNSCNPVFVELALRMGQDTFYRYLRAFGLGVKTGVDLPGEGSGILINARYVKDVDLARIGFGQSVAVTPIQLLTAACAVVNGGRLMRPYLVEEITSASGEVLTRTLPKVVGVPISEETSATMRELLEGVVSEGGGRNAQVAGYRVGGKTGTAQVYKDGKIVRDVHIGSFLGFAPADAPRVAILVIVDEARVPVDYGGTTAAPFARQVLEDTLQYLGYPRGAGAEAAEPVTVPDVVGQPFAQARKALSALGLNVLRDEGGDTVTAQMPAAGARLLRGGQVMLYTDESGGRVSPETLVLVPDVLGRSIVDAARTLRARGLFLQVEGSGLAIRQIPVAGSYVSPAETISVVFSLPQ